MTISFDSLVILHLPLCSPKFRSIILRYCKILPMLVNSRYNYFSALSGFCIGYRLFLIVHILLLFMTGRHIYWNKWLLYAPTGVTLNNCTFCPHCIYVFWIYLKQTLIFALRDINWLVFVTGMESVYWAVRIGSLNKNSLRFGLKG